MSKIMIFRHDNSDLDFRLEPLNVPDSVTMDNVKTWLMSWNYDSNDVFTVIEVGCTATYQIKQRPPRTIEHYIERVPDFSIFNHEQNGR